VRKLQFKLYTQKMKKLATIIAIVGFACASFAQQRYSKVKIFTDSEGLSQLATLGLAVDHGKVKHNTFFISDFSETDIEKMSANGFEYEILIEDVKAFYAERNLNPEPYQKNVNCTSSGGGGGFTPVAPVNHFENNGYAGFYKYQDMLDALDDMAAMYPALITVRAPISTFLTHEGRPIYHVKISDSPALNDSTEPKVLYTAIHHAREPMSMSQTIFYMWYLLENYATDPEVQYLVDNVEMYFVPCINPDGYIENETNDPSGFGFHRKNKAPVGGSNPGVDLNRNYSYGWNTTGVSADPNSDTYPGTSAFSEPETSAIKWLVESVNFTLASNSHSYGDLQLHPVGTTNAEFADHHDYFTDITVHMTQYNNYEPMKSSGLYPASGDSDDYMYKVDIGVGEKDTIFAMTPEVGDDFWPSQSGIVPTCLEMIFPNLMLAHLALKFHLLSDADASSMTTMTGDFTHNLKRLGRLEGPATVTVLVEPILNIQSVGAPVVHSLAIRETTSAPISYVLDPAVVFGSQIKYVLTLDYGTFQTRDTITKTFGSLTLQYSEDASNTANWTGDWSVTSSEFVSPSTSFTDSPSGNYSNNTTKTFEFDQDIDLTNATAAEASFYAMWEIEADYDYCQFQVSVDGGSSWIGQCGNYTVPGDGSSGSVQPDGEPVYEGTQGSWVDEKISLSDYLGDIIRVRFVLESDGGLRKDGFYFDDFAISFDVNDNSLDEFAFDVKTIPNPANQQAYISFSKVISDGAVKIYNQAGQLVQTDEITEQTNKITVNTGNFRQGVYFVFVEENGIAVKPVKLVIVH
jgi:carboxypeptidase T